MRYLTPSEVTAASRYLQETAWDQLASLYDPARMKAVEVYPDIWDQHDSLDYLRDNYQALVRFFGFAAATGDAVILWLC